MTGFKFYDEYYNMVMNNEEGKLCNIQNIDCMVFHYPSKYGFKMVEIIPSKILYVTKE